MLKCSFFDGIIYQDIDFNARNSDFFGAGIVDPTTDFALTYPGGLEISLAAGTAWNSAGVRLSYDASPAVTLTCQAANITNPRIDLVEIGYAYGTVGVSSTVYAQIIIKEGTAAASPSQPTTDTGYVALFAINVPANATSISSSNVTDLRTAINFSNINIPDLPLLGGTMTGSINMNSNKITNVGEIDLIGPAKWAQGANIASGATVDLSTATGNSLTITGTTTITSFGTVQAGSIFTLTFAGALTITYNATSMIIPGGTSLAINAGDSIQVLSLGSGNWKIICYEPAGAESMQGQKIVNLAAGTLATDATNLGQLTFNTVRQTVLTGAVDLTYGMANFLSPGAGLAVNLAATSIPVRITFAAGFNTLNGAPIDYLGIISTDVSSAWSSLPTNQSAVFLYIDRNTSTGALTYSYSLLQPIYAYLAPGSPATDQHWFDLNNMIMNRWNGSAWVAVQRIFVGECVTGASSVTSVISYALRGMYDSGWFAVTNTQNYTKNHNIGIPLSVGLDTNFYFSIDSAGADSSITQDIYTTYNDGNTYFIGHFNKQNIANTVSRYALNFSFADYVQYYKGVLQSSGYYRVFIKRQW